MTGPGPREQQIALLEAEKKKWVRTLVHDRHTVRNFDSDPGSQLSCRAAQRDHG